MVNGLSSETLATFDGDDPEANNLNNEKSLSKVQSILLTKSDGLTKSARFLSPYKPPDKTKDIFKNSPPLLS